MYSNINTAFDVMKEFMIIGAGGAVPADAPKSVSA